MGSEVTADSSLRIPITALILQVTATVGGKKKKKEYSIQFEFNAWFLMSSELKYCRTEASAMHEYHALYIICIRIYILYDTVLRYKKYSEISENT